MEIIVHAGMQKTGSSAVQRHLYEVREQLASVKLIYPDLDHLSHRYLSAALAPDPVRTHDSFARREPTELMKQVKRARNRAANQIRGADKDDTIILSHEGFSEVARTARLRTFLDRVSPPDTRVAVLAYVRNPLDLYPSALQNSLRAEDARIRPPGTWQSPHPKRASALERAFGDRLTLKVYARPLLTNGDVIDDVAHFIEQVSGKPVPVSSDARADNSSVSAHACAMLHLRKALRARALSEPAGAALRQAIVTHDQKTGGPKLRLPDAWRATIARSNADDWNAFVASRAPDQALNTDGGGVDVGAHDMHEWLIDAFDSGYAEGVVRRLQRASSPATDEAASWISTNLLSGSFRDAEPDLFMFRRKDED